jgi:hypothetical protein
MVRPQRLFMYFFFRSALMYFGGRLLWIAALVAVIAVGLKGWRLYTLAQALRADVQALEALASAGPDRTALATLGPLLADARANAALLRAEAAPLLPAVRHLGWLPGYGPDLAAAGPLLDLAASLSRAADESFAALMPIVHERDASQPPGAWLARQLTAARPQLEAARQELARAAAARAQIATADLSPPLRDRLERLDHLLPLAQDGVDLALALPDLLGAHGRQEYLVIAQNPDELRATGGLITAAGVLTFEGGRLTDFSVADSGAVNDFQAHRYPDPPAPLARYMGLEMWAFQDANWSPDFPTAARAAAQLYQLGQGRAITNVIAIDPGLIQLLLTATGPITVPGSADPVTAENVLAYMRNADRSQEHQWWLGRKAFMGPLAQALIDKLGADLPGPNWPALIQAVGRALDERHLQIAVEHPLAAAVFARRGWDGAVRPGAHDFLMVVDSNLGYNKVNPNIDEQATYSIDLSDPGAPIAELTIRHRHRLNGPAACDQARGYATIITVQRYEELMTGCYWDYLRVLVPGGSRLIATSAHPVPGAWMLSGVGDDGVARMGAGEAGTQAISVFLVVPPGEERRTVLRYRLPPAVLAHDARGYHYRLTIQKQAGAAPLPVAVNVRLPAAATVVSSSAVPVAQDGQTLSFSFVLVHDQQLDLTFQARAALSAQRQ